jgi:hypothetical protein
MWYITKLNSTFIPTLSSSKVLSVDASGNVILVNGGTVGGSTIPDSLLVKYYGSGLNKNVSNPHKNIDKTK